MVVGKNLSDIINTNLSVDKWNVQHINSGQSGDSYLEETYQGRVDIEQTSQTKYLGFILSNKGSNMPQIDEVKKKSIWIIRKIFAKLESLNLKKYYFQSAVIFLNVILRSSILYASETFYNLKETEVRHLERIEETFLRKMFKTSKGCPIAQLYLESGHFPARFAIMKSKLMFLKYLLEENPNSLIYRFLKLQLENPTRGDWVSSCLIDLKDLQINLSFEQIEKMTKKQFNSTIKESIQKRAFEYLIRKKKSKGKEIKYSELKMADYLIPGYEQITINEQRNIFSIRNQMVEIPHNFPTTNEKEICRCREEVTMKHIYECEFFSENDKTDKPKFEQIYEGNLVQQKEINEIFQQNYQ